MFIWRITCEVHWESSVKGEDDWTEEEDYSICAEDFTKAIAKLNKLVLSPKRTLRDADDVGVKIVFKPTAIEDIINVERGDWLDA